MLKLGQGRGCTSLNPPRTEHPAPQPTSSLHPVAASPRNPPSCGCWGGRKRVVVAHAEAERGLGAPSSRGAEPTVRQGDAELAWSAGPARAPGLHRPPPSRPAFPGPWSPCTREHRRLRAGGATRAPAFHRRTLKHRARGSRSKASSGVPSQAVPLNHRPSPSALSFLQSRRRPRGGTCSAVTSPCSLGDPRPRLTLTAGRRPLRLHTPPDCAGLPGDGVRWPHSCSRMRPLPLRLMERL